MIPDFSLDTTMGAAFIGVVVAAILHGVSCVQAWYYFTHQHDQWPLKSIVAAVMVFDTVHQALICHTGKVFYMLRCLLYTYLITHYGNAAELQRTVWSLLAEVLFNGFTAFLVQSFLALRVWRLSNRKILVTVIVALLVVAEFGCVIAFGTLALINVHNFAELATLKYLSISVNALAAAGDVLIAGTLCLLLHRSRTGFQKKVLTRKQILFAVNTGLLTSLCAVASLISILTAPNTFIYITFFFCMGRLYSNSLLATLNARKRIRTAAEGINSSSEISFSLKDISKASAYSSRRGPNISIKIDTTKEFTSDVDRNVVLAGPPTEDGLPDNSSSKASCTFREMVEVA
ncbi:hypothetical protein ARMSODRAFT_982132 [Armillaria solidipes]|uniref:DUF6534 domain-containing protein n=1 Tax=Armillaria solidipes TaxID=1076256 RepID=A0A2H3B3M6_9AGAR|nr:hypothetical protein ARMSODRAFT_982132 [Armillaria solidipes]